MSFYRLRKRGAILAAQGFVAGYAQSPTPGTDYHDIAAPAGFTNGKEFACVAAGEFDAADMGSTHFLVRMGFGNRFSLEKNSADRIVITLKNQAGGTIYLKTHNEPIVAGVPYIFHFSSNQATGQAHFYINEVEDLVIGGTDPVDDLIHLEQVWQSPTSGTNGTEGRRGPVWTAAEYINFSVQANRNAFNDGLIIKDWGADGSLPSPTSRQPEVCVQWELGAATVNKGSGPALVQNGQPTYGVW